MKTESNSRSRSPRIAPEAVARNEFKEAAESTRDSVVGMGSAAKRLARSEFASLSEHLVEFRDELLDRVSKRPMKSILIAAGAGVVVGFLMRRPS